MQNAKCKMQQRLSTPDDAPGRGAAQSIVNRAAEVLILVAGLLILFDFPLAPVAGPAFAPEVARFAAASPARTSTPTNKPISTPAPFRVFLPAAARPESAR